MAEHTRPPVDTRVALTAPIDRFPHFIAPEGSTGTVVLSDEHVLAVRLDLHLPGCEGWNNEVMFTDDDDVRWTEKDGTHKEFLWWTHPPVRTLSDDLYGRRVSFPLDHKDLNNEPSPFRGLDGRVIKSWGRTKTGLDLLIELIGPTVPPAEGDGMTGPPGPGATDLITHEDLATRYQESSLLGEFPAPPSRFTEEMMEEFHGAADYEDLADLLTQSRLLVEADPSTVEIEPTPFPLCRLCMDNIGGAAAGPDAPWRPLHDGENCEAVNCSAEESLPCDDCDEPVRLDEHCGEGSEYLCCDCYGERYLSRMHGGPGKHDEGTLEHRIAKFRRDCIESLVRNTVENVDDTRRALSSATFVEAGSYHLVEALYEPARVAEFMSDDDNCYLRPECRFETRDIPTTAQLWDEESIKTEFVQTLRELIADRA